MQTGTGLNPGIKGNAQAKVHDGNTALAMGSGEIEVFATPAMVALMEEAAVQCVKGSLGEGETSVGVRMEISHIAATPVGMGVRAEAVLQRVDGRRLFFQVVAFDEKEKIGEGEHERFVVQRDRFLSKVQSKK
jgi:fluoroacetyl-CoA thioesterase